MNLDETIKYYVEKAEDCEAISKKNNRLVGFTSFKDDTSRLKKFLNHFAPTKLRGDDDET